MLVASGRIAQRPPKTVVITQSNYIPWKGYFDLIRSADELVILDNVQSTKNDWRNRNRIKSANGEMWLTIPINHSLNRRISQVTVADHRWPRRHYRSIEQAYARAPFLPDYRAWLLGLYDQAAGFETLSQINNLFLDAIIEKLTIKVEKRKAEDILSLDELDRLSPTERLVEMARKLDATTYLSGPAAKSYLDEAAFKAANIAVRWMNYDGFREYPQLHGDFRHDVSILDLILMTGPEAGVYLHREKPTA